MSNSIFIDIGNSYAKWKYKDKYFKSYTNDFDFSELPNATRVWSSNVSHRTFKEYEHDIFTIVAQKKYKLLQNSYRNPDQLGSDRWLAMIASFEINQNNNFVVLDIGTAVTIDFVLSGSHQGGLILPGLSHIRSTFNSFSLKETDGLDVLGSSTEEAWSIGTIYMLTSAINKKIQMILKQHPNTSVYVSGGGFNSLKDYLEFPHIYHENLVLDGIEFFAEYMG